MQRAGGGFCFSFNPRSRFRDQKPTGKKSSKKLMQLSFYGAAQTVTGSKHIITLNNGKRILLDCGMFQGKGQKNEDLNSDFLFNPVSIDYLILSHAHIDHCGLIPRLVKLGFKGTIYCTPPTVSLSKLLLEDSAGIQASNARNNGNVNAGEPLYNMEDVENSLALFRPIAYNKTHSIDENIEVLFTDAGHILGSAMVNLTLTEDGVQRKLCFTGDIGRFNNRILCPPAEIPQPEIIICESTYGDTLHQDMGNAEERLLQIVQHTCLEKGGNLIIPAFSVGRTQELIFSLNKLAEDGKLPPVEVFVDSPLSVYATDIMRENLEYFNSDMQDYVKSDPDPFHFTGIHFITERNDSIQVNYHDKPCIIISASGMMEGGRIQHHLKQNISDPRNTILITGYCEPSTLGGRISSGAQEVFIMGDAFPVKAEVVMLNEYSAHGDYSDILKLLLRLDKEKIRQVFLVHGEKTVMANFKSTLREKGFRNVEIAEFRMSYEV
jgi:metallo-beta-lactamase family protein